MSQSASRIKRGKTAIAVALATAVVLSPLEHSPINAPVVAHAAGKYLGDDKNIKGVGFVEYNGEWHHKEDNKGNPLFLDDSGNEVTKDTEKPVWEAYQRTLEVLGDPTPEDLAALDKNTRELWTKNPGKYDDDVVLHNLDVAKKITEIGYDKDTQYPFIKFEDGEIYHETLADWAQYLFTTNVHIENGRYFIKVKNGLVGKVAYGNRIQSDAGKLIHDFPLNSEGEPNKGKNNEIIGGKEVTDVTTESVSNQQVSVTLDDLKAHDSKGVPNFILGAARPENQGGGYLQYIGFKANYSVKDAIKKIEAVTELENELKKTNEQLDAQLKAGKLTQAQVDAAKKTAAGNEKNYAEAIANPGLKNPANPDGTKTIDQLKSDGLREIKTGVREDALAKLKEAYDKKKAEIQAKLTGQEQADALNELENAYSAAQTAVNNATDVNDIITKRDEGVKNIEAVSSESKQALADAKAAAKKALAEELARQKQAIADNNNLSPAEKDLANQKLQAAYEAAVGAVEAAKKPADATAAGDLGVAKLKAIGELEQKKSEKEAAIKANADLDEDAKKELVKKLDQELEKAVTAVTNAPNAQGVETEKNNSIKAFNRVADVADLKAAEAAAEKEVAKQTNLTEQQKSDLKKQLQADLATAVAGVETPAVNDPDGANAKSTGLTNFAKSAAKAALEDKKAEIEKEVNKAAEATDITSGQKDALNDELKQVLQTQEGLVSGETTPARVDTAKGKGIEALEAVRAKLKTAKEDTAKAKQALADAKAKAKQALAEELARQQKAIEDNKNLSDDEKKLANEKLQAAYEAAVKAVDGATKPEGATAAGALGVAKLKGIGELEKAAGEALAAAKDLPDADKKLVRDKVAEDLEKAIKAVNGATTDADVTTKKEAGLTQLGLDKAKAEAFDELEKAAKAAQEAIEADKFLTADEKKAHKDKVAADLTAAVNAVNGAPTDTAVTDAKKAGLTNFDKSAAKAAAEDKKKEIDDVVAKAAKAGEITSDQQKALADKLAGILKDQEPSIDTPKDQAGVESAKQAVIKALEAVREDLNTAKETTKQLKADRYAAIEELTKAANAAKDAIDKDPNLTDAEKDAAKKAIDGHLKNAVNAVNEAKTSDDVTKAKDAGLANIALDKAKADAIAELEKAAKAAVGAAKDLSAAEKEAVEKKVAGDLQQAIDAVNGATTTDDVNTKKEAGLTQLGVDKAQADAVGELEKKAKAAKKAIAAAKNLSDDEKGNAAKKVDGDLEQAIKNVKGATTDTAVTDAKNAGLTAIDKSAAKAAVADKKAEIAKLVDAAAKNKDLAADKQKDLLDRLGAIQAKYNDDATGLIDQATNQTEVADTQTKGIAELEALKGELDAAKKVLADAKAAAIAELEKAAKAAKDAIDKDQNLTADEKKAHKDKVDADLQLAIKAVNDATTTDEVTTAKNAGFTDFDKSAAKAAVEDKKKEIETAVNEAAKATDLTPGQQKALNDELAKILKEQEPSIDTPTDRDGVKTAKEAVIKALEDVRGEFDKAKAATVAAKLALAAAKAAAEDELRKAAEAATTAIAADNNLSDAEKADAQAKVQADLEEALKNVAGATTPDEVNTHKTAGLTAIAKDAALAALLNKKNEVDNAINDAFKKDQISQEQRDKLLGESDKDYGTKKAYGDAVNNVNDAKTVDAVNGAKDAGIVELEKLKADLEKAKAAKSALDQAKAAAIAELKKKEAEDEALIDANPNLTPDQKSAKKQALKDALQDAIGKVNGAKNETDVDTAKQAGLAKFDEIMKQSDADALQALNAAKEAAIKALQEAAKKAEEAIKADKNLTDAQKQDLLAKLQSDLNNAIGAVNAANTVADVDTAKEAGLLNIGKDAAIAALKDKEAEDEKAIDANPNLTDAQKGDLKKALQKALADAIGAVNGAKDQEEVDQAKQAGFDEFDKIMANADNTAKAALAAAKDAAIAALKAAEKQAEDAVNADKNLTDDQKQELLKKLQSDLANAIDAVTAATTVAGVDTAKNAGLLDIAKDAAIAALKDKEAEDEALIDANPNLSDDQKAEFKKALRNALAQAIGAVNAAPDVAAVAAAQQAGFDEFAKIMAAADKAAQGALAAAKTAAIDELNAAEKKAEEAINADQNLTDTQKKALIEQLRSDLATAIAAVNAAPTIADVEKAKQEGLTAFAKSVAKGALEDKKAHIEKLVNEAAAGGALAPEHKQKLIENLQAILLAYEGKDDVAKDRPAVEDVKTTGIIELDKVKDDLAKLTKAKADAIAALKEQEAKDEAEIAASKNLTPEQKETFLKDLQAALTAAITAVNGATTLAAVDTAKNDGFTEFEKIMNRAKDVHNDLSSTMRAQGVNMDRCIPALLGVGIPMALLIPLGLVAQLDIPGLAPLREQLDGLLGRNDDEHPAGSSLPLPFDPATQRLAGGIVAVVLAALAATWAATSCIPGADLSSKKS